MNPLKIAVIIGSTRSDRFGEKPSHWIFEEAKKLPDTEVKILDLKDHMLPFFDGMPPSMVKDGNYGNPAVNAWAKEIAWADAYIIVTPEYSHGPSAVLKNALDSIYAEWHNKAVGFVAYGSVGGARAVEQLRQVCVELHMASTRTAVHIPGNVVFGSGWNEEVATHMAKPAGEMLGQLVWWGNALKTAREQSK